MSIYLLFHFKFKQNNECQVSMMPSVAEQACNNLETVLSVPELSPNAIFGIAQRRLLLSDTSLPQQPYLPPLPASFSSLILQQYLEFLNSMLLVCISLYLLWGNRRSDATLRCCFLDMECSLSPSSHSQKSPLHSKPQLKNHMFIDILYTL